MPTSLLDPQGTTQVPTGSDFGAALAQAYQAITDAMTRQQAAPQSGGGGGLLAIPPEDRPTGRYLKWGHAPPQTWTQQLNATRPFVQGADPGMQGQPYAPGTSDDPPVPLVLAPHDEDQDT